MITFKGYKNIITNDIIFNDKSRMAFIATQLNDIGSPDLAELKKINEMSFLDTNNDVLIMLYSKYRTMPQRLFFGDKSLYLGDELLSLQEECGDTYNYKREEKASMKAYTLMASLTKRMMQNPLYTKDADFSKVFHGLFTYFSDALSKNSMHIFETIQDAVMNGKPLDMTASFFNDFVNINMKKFFKF